MTQPKWIDRPAANLSRRNGIRPQGIILHHTGGSEAGDLATLTRSKPVGGVSADFLINREGLIYKLNPQLSEFYTWHAGASRYPGLTTKNNSVNVSTIGIEMSHRMGEGWPEAQVRSCAVLCKWLVATGKISQKLIVSHRAIAIPPGRKIDPENFPWGKFGEIYLEA